MTPGAALPPDDRAEVLALLERIEAVTPYVSAALREANGGRVSSGVRQMQDLLAQARALRAGLIARAEASAEGARQDVQRGRPTHDDEHDPTFWGPRSLCKAHHRRAARAVAKGGPDAA